jgi:hypothetical protein
MNWVWILLVLVFTPLPLIAEEKPNQGRWFFGFGGGVWPHKMEEAYYDISLTDEADYSPVPSVVRLDRGESTTASGLSLEFAYGPSLKAHGVQGEKQGRGVWVLKLGFAFADILMIDVGTGLRIDWPLTRRLYVSTGGEGYFFLLTGTIGEVGSSYGDEYLEAPDGQIYYEGSRIAVKSYRPGGGISGGLRYLISDRVDLFANVGYQFAPTVDTWTYMVEDPPTASGKRRSSTLPASGFAQHPPPLTIGGLTFQVGVGIPLSSQQRSSLPKATPKAIVPQKNIPPEPSSPKLPQPVISANCPGLELLGVEQGDHLGAGIYKYRVLVRNNTPQAKLVQINFRPSPYGLYQASPEEQSVTLKVSPNDIASGVLIRDREPPEDVRIVDCR